MCKLYQPQGLEKIPEIINVGPLIRPQGLEKNAKLITLEPTSIQDSRVGMNQFVR